MGCQAQPLIKVLEANSTDAAFTALAPTTTEPTGAGVVPLTGYPGGLVPEKFKLMVFGTDTADQTGKVRVTGWMRQGADPNYTLWVPTTLVEATFTLGTMAGVANADVAAGQLFADTVAIDAEPVSNADTTDDGRVDFFSPANNTIAWIKACTYQAEKLQVQFNLNTSSASLNALLQLMDD